MKLSGVGQIKEQLDNLLQVPQIRRGVGLRAWNAYCLIIKPATNKLQSEIKIQANYDGVMTWENSQQRGFWCFLCSWHKQTVKRTDYLRWFETSQRPLQRHCNAPT